MNKSPVTNRRILLISVLFMFLLVLLSGGMGVYVLSDEELYDALSVSRIALEIEHSYPGVVDWDDMFDSAMVTMFSRLDRYSSYVKREQLDQFDEELSGGYGGIGVTVIRHDSGLLIMSVREGGPAAHAGILSGDIIVEADSTSLVGLSVSDASGLLRGEQGTEVLLKVIRPVSRDTIVASVTRDRIDFLHVPYAGITPDSVLYIRLLDFDAGAADDVAAALDSLLANPDTKPVGVILDLHGNPGGLFSEAYRTANLFLEDGQFIVGTDARSRWLEERHYSTGDDATGGLPMAVIVDNGSASASEIVAGALKQLDRAILVGDTTFGKGLVQGFSRFWDGSGLRLTISRYFLEGDVFLNEFDSTLEDTGHGLPPDVYFKSEEYRDFPRALESSLLLRRFANQYQDEIIKASGDFKLPDTWIARFKQYCHGQGFDYISEVTERAQLVNDVAFLDRSHVKTLKAAGRMLSRAKRADGRVFETHADYIKMRLKQIAFERKFGVYQAYASVLVHERPDILLASHLLLGGEL